MRTRTWISLGGLVLAAALLLSRDRREAIHPRDVAYREIPTYSLEPLDRRWLEPPPGFAIYRTEAGVDVALPAPGEHVARVVTVETRASRRVFELTVELPPALELAPSEGGVVLVQNATSREERAIFRNPIGIDARGRRIDYRYRVDNGRLTLAPRHRWQMEKASYPVEVHAAVASLDWSEALVKAGENCLGCARDGDVVSVHPAGWNWGLEEHKRFAIVRVPKLSARERSEIRARTLIVADPATPEEYARIAEERGLFRYAVDYTELATSDELEAIRDRDQEGPVLDARNDPTAIRPKRNLYTSILRAPFRRNDRRAPSLLDSLFRNVSAATVVTNTIGTAGRNYSTITAWEAGQNGNLVAANTIQKGEMYNDGQFDESNVLIDGSTADADHFMWLTVAPTERHNGTAHDGASFTGVHLTAASGNVLEAADSYTLVEWIIFHDWGSGSTQKRGLDLSQINAVGRYNIFWGGSSPHGTATGITVDRDDAVAYNNIIYGLPGGSNGGYGIRTEPTEDRFRAFNNTVYNCLVGFFSDATSSTVTARNNMVVFNGTDYSGPFDAASSHNVDSDGTAPGGFSMTILPPALSTEFQSQSFPEDFHLKATATVIGQGTDLTSSMAPFDIDLQYRGSTWDRGADEFAGTTEVSLVELTATRSGDDVAIEWRTASELDNLGFHVYRAYAETGPYERITESLIPGLGSSPTGASYRHVDTVEGAGAVYYELEDVDTRGKTVRHGPVQAVAGPTESAFPETSSRVTFGDPSANRIAIHREPRGATLVLTTAGLYGEPQPDGTMRLVVPGFEAGSAAPVKHAWVKALSGRGVEIVSVEKEAIAFVDGWKLSTDVLELTAERGGTVRLARSRRRKRQTSQSGARVLELAYQGETKKALVELSPIEWNARAGRVAIAGKLTVRLSFAERDRGDRVRSRRSHRARHVAIRLQTTEAGLHHVRYEDVVRGQRSFATRRVRLSRLGEDVPFHVEPNPRRFRPGSTLFFVAESPSDNPYASANTYELELRGQGTQMDVASSHTRGAPVAHYWRRIHLEENRLYQAALMEAPDPWLWDTLFAPERKRYPFSVSELAPSAGPAHITVGLQGASDLDAAPDHHVRIYVNDVFAGEARWNGKASRTIEVDAYTLVDGDNAVDIENVGDTDAAYSMVLLDAISIRYPRRLVAAVGRLEGAFDTTGVADVTGVSDPYVVDVTEAPVWVDSTPFNVEAGKHYLVVDRDAVPAPAIATAKASTLKTRLHPADYVVIGPQSFLDAVRPLLAHRRAQDLRVREASLEEIYSAFGFGEPRPEAIHDFVGYAYHQWRGELRYVLLLGDGSFDFKNFLGTDTANHVPPHMVKTRYLWTASDPAYASVVGDDLLPDVAIGRLPASNEAELRTMIDKILAYENGPPHDDAPMVVVADNADKAGHFEADADDVAALAPSTKIYLGELGITPTRDAVVRAFADGAPIVSYVGHGGINLWANENIFNTQDVASLASPPASRLPIVMTMNCLNGYWHFPYFDALSESLVAAEDAGAIAAFSPSGLSVNEPAHLYHRALLDAVLSGRHRRLGDAVLEAQTAYADTGAFPELLSIYHLFGDPALVLH